MKIGVLATLDGLLAGRYLRALLQVGVRLDCVLLDPKPTDPRDIALHEQRANGSLAPIPLHDVIAPGMACLELPSHNDPTMRDLVRERGLDLLVNAGTPRRLSRATLDAPRTGVLNCHPGLLPGYRGSSCVEWALFFDEPVGNSVHLMTEGIDEGPVLMSEAVALGSGSSYPQIRVAVYQAGFALMARACRDLQCGKLGASDFYPQGEGRYHKPIDPESLDVVLKRYPEAA